jgi:hypothetical protein
MCQYFTKFALVLSKRILLDPIFDKAPQLGATLQTGI